MFSIEIFQTATDDLQKAFDWYEEQSIGLGERFVNEVDIILILSEKTHSNLQCNFQVNIDLPYWAIFPFELFIG